LPAAPPGCLGTFPASDASFAKASNAKARFLGSAGKPNSSPGGQLATSGSSFCASIAISVALRAPRGSNVIDSAAFIRAGTKDL